jgi:DNA invertase Pin-like site-specific DNA recombinase
MQKIQCAVYVRKSTEHGLEQEFNSLDNQELACRSYIASQTFQGWEFAKTYSDGGISGGTMARPGLQEMLADIKAGKIQCVLVYKIDRLSRSIYDFKRMMKKDFEPHDCNLVSITQSFDTSSAMGKLTLNMLLSFAEFEREVSGERVRDKIRATKSKGMWVGGIPPLGYDVLDGKLVINETEAETVREIFKTYMESTGMSDCRLRLIDKGIRGKRWTTSKGESKGGTIIAVSSLDRILKSQTYIGKIVNKRSKEVFDGQHDAIVSQELFDTVQQKLTDGNTHKGAPYSRGTALLNNKLVTAKGEVFKNRGGNKENGLKKYRYYRAGKTSLPSGDIENIVTGTIKKFLDSDMASIPADKRLALKQIDYTDGLLQPMIDRIVHHDRKLTIFVNIADTEYLAPFKTKSINQNAEPIPCYITDDGKYAVVEAQVYINTRTCINHRCDGGEISVHTKSENTQILTKALAFGWRYKKLYEDGTPIEHIMESEHRAERTVYKYLSLAYLSPKIIGDILDGEVPPHVNLQTLFGIAEKHSNFTHQERAYYGV